MTSSSRAASGTAVHPPLSGKRHECTAARRQSLRQHGRAFLADTAGGRSFVRTEGWELGSIRSDAGSGGGCRRGAREPIRPAPGPHGAGSAEPPAFDEMRPRDVEGRDVEAASATSRGLDGGIEPFPHGAERLRRDHLARGVSGGASPRPRRRRLPAPGRPPLQGSAPGARAGARSSRSRESSVAPRSRTAPGT